MRFLVFVCVIFILFSNNANAEAGDILINNENKIIKLDKPFELKENYILTISRLKDKPTSVLISLSKNNKKVCPDKPEYVGYSYLYICLNKKTNKKLLRFKLGNFVGDDSIRITNIFQYSDGSFVVTQTPVKTATPTPTPTKTVIQTTSKPTVGFKDVYVNQDHAVKVSNSKNESNLKIYIINFMLYILLVIVPTYILLKYGTKTNRLLDDIMKKL